MKKILSFLSINLFTFISSFSVVSCKNGSGGSDNPPTPPVEQTYDISFDKITKIEGYNINPNFKLSDRLFCISKKSIVGPKGLPTDFFDILSSTKNYVAISFFSQTIWDDMAKVYGYTIKNTAEEIDQLTRNNTINNVSMKIVRGSYPFGFDTWVMQSFSATINDKQKL